VLQGNIARTTKWDPALRDVITSRYITMTRGLGQGCHVHHLARVIHPFYFEEGSDRAAI
jgi:hypothetical protein